MIFHFHELAVEEIGIAKAWYQERSSTASLRLLGEIEGALVRIARAPELCPQFYGKFAGCGSDDFPIFLFLNCSRQIPPRSSP